MKTIKVLIFKKKNGEVDEEFTRMDFEQKLQKIKEEKEALFPTPRKRL